MAADVGFPVDRIHVIRNGVDLGRFAGPRAAAVRPSFDLPDEGAVVVGAVGRLVDVKDHASLIDAIHVLRSQGRACRP